MMRSSEAQVRTEMTGRKAPVSGVEYIIGPHSFGYVNPDPGRLRLDTD